MSKVIYALALLVSLLPGHVQAQSRWREMGITSPEMAAWFQKNAGPQDIARVDHPNDIGLIAGITVGRKMIIFKTVSQIKSFLASNPNGLDIIGYNLEAGQTNDPNELADPVGAAKAVRAVAQQYGKLVAIGLTKSLTNQYGPDMAPYAHIWILQVQKAQNNPSEVVAWVKPMSAKLKAANPNLEIGVQIRTDSESQVLGGLVAQMPWLEGVSILTQRSDVQPAISVASVFFGKPVVAGAAQAVAGSPQVAAAPMAAMSYRVEFAPGAVDGMLGLLFLCCCYWIYTFFDDEEEPNGSR